MAQELGREPDNDLATRTGEFAMAIYSVGMSSQYTFPSALTYEANSCCPGWHSASSFD